MDFYQQLKSLSTTQRVTCPACLKITVKDSEGIVTLVGSYLWEHEAEIKRILGKEAKKAFAKIPQERIIRMTKDTIKGSSLLLAFVKQLPELFDLLPQASIFYHASLDPLCRAADGAVVG